MQENRGTYESENIKIEANTDNIDIQIYSSYCRL